MPSPSVSSVTIPELLQKLHIGEYVVPRFQREFVWDMQQVCDLAWSVLRDRPIGMATLWETIGGDSPLEPRSVRLPESGGDFRNFCEDPSEFAGTSYGILDGQQRCTALAMAFGGLRTEDKRRRTTGRFFVDLKVDLNERCVHFKKEKAVLDEGLSSLSGALGAGFLPLEVPPNQDGQWEFTQAWMPLLERIASDDIYDGAGPDEEEREFRKSRLMEMLAAVGAVKLAVLTVDSSYGLAEICEIFETLNQTGTKVSTVDLIHSFVLQESSTATPPVDPPMDVRDWLDHLGTLSGAEGWSASEPHPERVAQAVTASYVGLLEKPPAREVGGKEVSVTSIKGPDLLRTPMRHWISIREDEALFAETFGLFQQTVVGGARFPMAWCPYVPGSLGVFFGLAWSLQVEDVEEEEGWNQDDLGALFRAFFWRNALSGRYDQGFLTQSSADMHALREMLRKRPEANSRANWLTAISGSFEALFGDAIKPSREDLKRLTIHGAGGARGDAILLAVRTKLLQDIVTQESIAYPNVNPEDIHKHHIWPKRWISNNETGKLKEILDEAKDNDWNRIDCAANLMPLSAETNREWRAKNPGQVLDEHNVNYEPATQELFANAFIDEEMYDLLRGASVDDVGTFQELRGAKIAQYLEDLMVPAT